MLIKFFFFFQAEDGIRDWSVTGVQTCALPISMTPTGLETSGRNSDINGYLFVWNLQTKYGRVFD